MWRALKRTATVGSSVPPSWKRPAPPATAPAHPRQHGVSRGRGEQRAGQAWGIARAGYSWGPGDFSDLQCLLRGGAPPVLAGVQLVLSQGPRAQGAELQEGSRGPALPRLVVARGVEA